MDEVRRRRTAEMNYLRPLKSSKPHAQVFCVGENMGALFCQIGQLGSFWWKDVACLQLAPMLLCTVADHDLANDDLIYSVL